MALNLRVGSSTVTQTVVEQPSSGSYTIPMTLNAPKEIQKKTVETPEDHMCLLLQKVEQAAGSLPNVKSQEVIQLVNEWPSEFLRGNPMSSPLDHVRLHTTRCIGYLYLSLQSVMDHDVESDEDLVVWDGLLEELKSLMSKTAPPGCTADDILATSKERKKEEQHASFELSLLGMAKRVMCDRSTQASMSQAMQFEVVKEDLQQTHEESIASQQRIHRRVGELTADMDALYQEFGNRPIADIQQIRQQLGTQDAQVQSSCSDLMSQLNKVPR